MRFRIGVRRVQIVVQEVFDLHTSRFFAFDELLELGAHLCSEGAVWLQEVPLIDLIILLATTREAMTCRQRCCAAKVYQMIVGIYTRVSHVNMNMHTKDGCFCSTKLLCATEVS